MRPEPRQAKAYWFIAFAHVGNWQCAPKARIISGGRFPPGELSIDPEADEQLVRVTARAEAS
jgi:hypothetical protein